MHTQKWFVGLTLLALAFAPSCGGDDSGEETQGTGSQTAHEDTGSETGSETQTEPQDTGSASATQGTTNDTGEGTGSESVDTSTGSDTTITELPDAPFAEVATYATTLANNDATDVYYPNPADLGTFDYAFPIALMLQGAYVDKQYYSGFARSLASWGFVVVVPNHKSKVMPVAAQNFIDLSVINAALDHMKAEQENAESPVHGALDTAKLILLGHSHGGQCGLNAIIGKCQLPCCSGGFVRPEEIVAGAFWGTSTIGGVNNEGVPIALIYGTKDTMAKPATIKTTYNALQHAPKALVSIAGANHYGECDVNNPPGALKDNAKPDVAQEDSSAAVGRWSGWFLRAHVYGDAEALGWVYETGSDMDPLANLEQSETE